MPINPLLFQLMSKGLTTPITPPTPAPAQPRGFSGLGRSFMGESIPGDEARNARQRAAIQAGMALLSSATKGNFGAGLAEGLGAFQGSMDRDLGAFVESRRRRGIDDLDRRRTEEGILSSQEGRERAGADEERRGILFGQAQEARRGAGSSAEALVEEIRKLAGPDSPEARRAEAMLSQGPEGLDDIEKVHDLVLRRYRVPEDFKQETDLDIERRKRIYKEDPSEVFRRQLQRERTDAYRERAGRSGGGRSLTPSALLGSVDREIRKQYDILVASHSLAGVLDPEVDPEELWKMANIRGKAATFDKLRELGIGSEYGLGDEAESRGGEEGAVGEIVRRVGGSPSSGDLDKVREMLGRGMSVDEIVSFIEEKIQGGPSASRLRPAPPEPTQVGAQEDSSDTTSIEPLGLEHVAKKREARAAAQESRIAVDALDPEIKARLFQTIGSPPSFDEPLARIAWERELRAKAEALAGKDRVEALSLLGFDRWGRRQ